MSEGSHSPHGRDIGSASVLVSGETYPCELVKLGTEQFLTCAETAGS
jgi:hypothetical protein